MLLLTLRTLLFMLLVGSTFVFPAWVLEASGEFISVDGAVGRFLLPRPVLLGLAYSDSTASVKLKVVQTAKPRVVALGTSRVMLFRSDWFQGSFFNAGGAHVLGDFQKFLDRLTPGGEPELLIIGVDQHFFNPNWDYPKTDIYQEADRQRPVLWRLFRTWDKVYVDWLTGKFQIADLTRAYPDGVERVGVRAIVRDTGFRNDGSQQFDRSEAHTEDLVDIERGAGVYVRGNSLSDRAFAELESFLSHCQRRGIYVAGFLPPYSPPVYDALEKQRGEYAFAFALADRLRPIFERYDFAFEDFTDPARFHMEDKGFVDGRHGSERAYQHLWSVWRERDPLLRKFGRGGTS